MTVKPGVGRGLRRAPRRLGPDGRKAPILVLGRFGAGRTLFSAIDDSWRWRFYTGESVFDTYWVQQLRYLARSKKLGQRRMTFDANRDSYELGEQVNLRLRVLDPVLLQQLPAEIRVEVIDENGQPVRTERLLRQEGAGNETVQASFTADRSARSACELPPFAGEAADDEQRLRGRGAQAGAGRAAGRPDADQPPGGRDAGRDDPVRRGPAKLPAADPQCRQGDTRSTTSEPLWDASLAMWIFVLLLTASGCYVRCSECCRGYRSLH